MPTHPFKTSVIALLSGVLSPQGEPVCYTRYPESSSLLVFSPHYPAGPWRAGVRHLQLWSPELVLQVSVGGGGEVLSQRMDGLLSTRWLLGHHLSVHKGSRGRSHSSLIPLFSSPLMCGPLAGLICLTSRTPPRSSSFPWGQQSEQSHLLRQLGFTAHISGFPARLFSSLSQFSAQ